MELDGKDDAPLKCRGLQCLFYLASDLAAEDKERVYVSKSSLQRHFDWCRLNQFQQRERTPYPDEVACSGVALKGKMHFKNHAAQIHNFIL